MSRRIIMGAVLAVTIAGGACNSSTSPEESGLTTEDVTTVALDTDLSSGIVVFGQTAGPFGTANLDSGDGIGISLALESTIREFEDVQRPCPVDGFVTLSGMVERVEHGEGLVEYFVEADGQQVECQRARRGEIVQFDGEFALEAERRRINGEPVGLQETHIAGWFDWQVLDSDRSGSCTYDLTSVRNPDAMKRTITGEICGREIDRTIDWKRGT
jgi:hypothetical protein